MGACPSKELVQERHVVIVGGGFGGCKVATELMKAEVPFTIIDPKDFFFVNIGALRAVIYTDFLTKTMIQYDITFGEHFKKGTVTMIDFEDKTVTISTGEKVKYTDLVLAVGSRGPFPGNCDAKSMDEARKMYNEISNELDKATNVIIIGGGAVGIELAGEIAQRYSAKLVTLIHPREILCSKRYPNENFQAKLRSSLRKLAVDVVVGRVSNMESLTFGNCVKQTVKLMEGDPLPADIVLCCTGVAPETNLTKTVFEDDRFDRFYRIKVGPELLVEGYSDVYALGDCCDSPQEKMAAHAEGHGELIAENILRSVKNLPPKPYKPSFDGMLVTVGSRGGAGIMNGWTVPSFMVSLLKGQNLFLPKFWAMMGQPIPDIDS